MDNTYICLQPLPFLPSSTISALIFKSVYKNIHILLFLRGLYDFRARMVEVGKNGRGQDRCFQQKPSVINTYLKQLKEKILSYISIYPR